MAHIYSIYNHNRKQVFTLEEEEEEEAAWPLWNNILPHIAQCQTQKTTAWSTAMKISITNEHVSDYMYLMEFIAVCLFSLI